MRWMAWTWPTAAFFACIVALITIMTIWELRAPNPPRRGLLPLDTTRGDRLFIGLVTTAFVHMAWLGLADAAPWPALGLSAVLMLAIGRWG